MSKQSLEGLTPNPRNPRKITKKKLEMLRESMAYYGDLSGIIQVEGGDLVGGHQRVDAYRSDPHATLEITQTFDPPLENGTTAEGYVTAGGSRFAYRRCRWAAEKARAAALAANKGAGDWDLPIVSDLMGELSAAGFDTDLTMFDGEEVRSLEFSPPGDDDLDGQLDKLPSEEGGMKTMTFALSAEQHATVTQRLEQAKKAGPFVDTENSNSNGNALARIAEAYRG